jgi:hypothetical protein
VPRVGARVRDAANGRVGEYHGQLGSRWVLRPPGGGLEWTAKPEDVQPAGSSAWVRALNAADIEGGRIFRAVRQTIALLPQDQGTPR